MPTVRANGLDIAYDVHGAGPPLVLLHGATSSGREDFAAQIPLLSKAFLVHVPDARGHAGTRWDTAQGFRYDWLVDDLEAFADALRLQTFHVLGFSMGAMTALQFAVRAPDRLRTLVVVGITTHREPRASVAQRLMDPERALQRDPRWAAELARRHDPVQGEGGWQRLLPAIAADIAVQPLLGPAELHSIDCPTMVVCGDHDPFVPVEHAAGIARQVPDGRLFVVPDCGHEVMVRRPGLFNEGLAGFYRFTEAVARARAEGRRPPPAVERAPTAEGELGHPEPEDVAALGQTAVRWLNTELQEGDQP
ncbi:MAG TPA: alpha/beta hydrolase [Candidatus Eisenbacteria bacterium]|nr:alpha/beta hydrolase [Candidatus Eisenbacteria bacterium]